MYENLLRLSVPLGNILLNLPESFLLSLYKIPSFYTWSQGPCIDNPDIRGVPELPYAPPIPRQRDRKSVV